MRDNISSNLKIMGAKSKLVLIILSLILLILEFVFHRHAEVELETIVFFPALYAFVVCIAIVLGGIILRKLIMRKEDYYNNG